MDQSPRPLWLARDELLATLLDVSSRAPPAAAAEIGALRLEVRVDGVSDHAVVRARLSRSRAVGAARAEVRRKQTSPV